MFRKETYVRRRSELRKRIEGGLVLLPGNGESPANYPSNQFRFRQDSTFLYFFGLNRPDYVGLMDIDSGEETLYGDDYTIDDIIWMGPQPTLDEQAREVGIGKTLPLSQLGKRIEAAVAKGRKVHFLPPYRGETTLQIARLLGLAPERVPLYASVELAKAVVALREIKDADEIDQIEKACEIGSKMHRMAMKMCRPGVVEREIAGAIESIALQHGAGVSFFSIVSQHGETLHNHCHEGTLLSGRLMLVDAGAETTMNYCSDFTRTFPVSGRFTQKQKDVYDIVLAANDRTFSLAGPDSYYYRMHNEASLVIAEGLKSLGLMRGDMQDAVTVGAQALFMPHGLGHQMGGRRLYRLRQSTRISRLRRYPDRGRYADHLFRQPAARRQPSAGHDGPDRRIYERLTESRQKKQVPGTDRDGRNARATVRPKQTGRTTGRTVDRRFPSKRINGKHGRAERERHTVSATTVAPRHRRSYKLKNKEDTNRTTSGTTVDSGPKTNRSWRYEPYRSDIKTQGP